MNHITTKVTKLGNGWYGCRCFVDNKLSCEIRVPLRNNISSAFKGMLRMLDKCGVDNKMVKSSRYRTNNLPTNPFKIIWY